MAYNNNQNESSLPTPGNNKKQSIDFLPKFFRTEANRKFLQATLDQLISNGAAEKIDGYVGRKYNESYKLGDHYLEDVSRLRNDYQFEPAVSLRDNLDNVEFAKDYQDYINVLKYFGTNIENHDRLNSVNTYSWTPHINWDTFTNFREYYWLPNGPLTVPVTGQSREITSTYSVTIEDQGDNVAYVFNDGFTRNPKLKLYRGQTYRFDIDTPGHPIAFSISRSFTPGVALLVAGQEGIRGDGLFDAVLYGNEYDQGEYVVLPVDNSVTFEADENVSTLFPDGIRKFDEEGNEVAIAYVEKGTIEFTVPFNAPTHLFYISQNEVNTSGQIRVYDVEENTFLNVEEDILNKKQYKSSNNIEFTNGLCIQFQGDVYPEKYSLGEWYVEGVGSQIALISKQDLTIPSAYTSDVEVPFDTNEFDVFPFDTANNFPLVKDYITINRATKDKNPWSRNNRWFHKDVVLKSFRYNNVAENLDDNYRASRPIIEFDAGIKLFNYGVSAKKDIDLLDSFTTDVFSTIQGQVGYIVDGIELQQGMRVLFTNDSDILVSGKIFEVKFINLNNQRVIKLEETIDTMPLDLETVFVKSGKKYSGLSFHYTNNSWVQSQTKDSINTEPMFDLCCPQGNSYADPTVFNSTTFKGTKIFSYKKGNGNDDTELGFPLSYRNIENSGDILFEFNLLTDFFNVQDADDLITIKTDTANLRKYKDRENFDYLNGWNNTPSRFHQYVIKDIEVDLLTTNKISIDTYNAPARLTDLKIIVYKNNNLLFNSKDYTIEKKESNVYLTFEKDLEPGDLIKIKTHSKESKNENGYYELPISLERNPLNDDITEFTLGEVFDHVDSMIEELKDFRGTYPGNNNLRDLKNISKFGKRFVKHESGLANTIYHFTSKEYNIIRAVEFSKEKYLEFKRNFFDTSQKLGFDGTDIAHVDKILYELNKDKNKTQPFYFSDMLAAGAAARNEYRIIDNNINFYPLTRKFNLDDLTQQAVYLYINGVQLVHGRDYKFTDDNFVDIFREKNNGDVLEIYEYESTDGSFIPSTPSKLGLYPTWYPHIKLDDTSAKKETIYNAGPFKIYGESELGESKNKFGYYYPVFTTKSAAKEYNTTSENTIEEVYFKGLNKVFYIPSDIGSFATLNDTEDFEFFPNVRPFIIGHDGSQILCYLDYRDKLAIELEKRIYNNIKVDYNDNDIDVEAYLGNDFADYPVPQEIQNQLLLRDFTAWQKFIQVGYAENSFYDVNNPFTFNYKDANNLKGKQSPGFWRKIYFNNFNTDNPHSCPWEMLGFTNKPTWWNTVYGPAPYTSNNLILWNDLELGRIADPENTRIDKRFVRPGLRNFIPVNEKGDLISPLDCNIVSNFNQRTARESFEFGDYSPVESAWRKSSDFPFALLRTLLLTNPADTIAKGFDLANAKRNIANQKTYAPTGKFIANKDIVVPNTNVDSVRTITSGLLNYIYNLVASDVLSVYTTYTDQLKNLQVNLSFRLAGFSDKQKINLILESKSPKHDIGSSGIFVPQENYKLVYNVSSPLENFTYSGVIVEKSPNGFIITGYNEKYPQFDYFKPLIGSTKYPVTVGGLSEEFSTWAPRAPYKKDQIVFHLNAYYRVTSDFTSNTTFTQDFLAKLSTLPSAGGRVANFYKNFDNVTTKSLSYGTILKTVQEVVDFLLGYGALLKSKGFIFDDVTDDVVNDWPSVAKEFMFWTTQGWADGTVISLSPSANELRFQTEYSVVDNIFDKFYDTHIIANTGDELDGEFSSLLRDGNSFGLKIKNSDLGLYGMSLPIVQKEHIVILDNTTIFNDVIYHPASGYRQKRIRVTGYRSDEWNGSLNVPGFLYDDAVVKEFEEYKDYSIGNIIKYKQFYYVATQNTIGSTEIDYNQWIQLNEKPVSDLITNFDYRASQFNDFYESNTASFDPNLQELSQRFIGFQKREYLSNLIIDDVSQLKFYQGMIQEKGSKNSIMKLFGALSSKGQESLEFFEEWAVKTGMYGSTEDIKQIEIQLSDTDIVESPQAVLFTDKIPNKNFDKLFRIKPSELVDKPADYTSNVFTVKPTVNEYVKTSGPVDIDDIDFEVSNRSDLSLGNINQFKLGGYIHLTNQINENWQVYQHTRLNLIAEELTEVATLNDAGELIYSVKFNKWISSFISVSQFIGIRDAQEYNLNGFYEVVGISNNTAFIKVPTDNNIIGFINEKLSVSTLREVRINSTTDINQIVNEEMYSNQKVWVDNYSNQNWAVLQNNSVYNLLDQYDNPTEWDSTQQNFTGAMVATPDNNNVFVAASGDDAGKIFVYRRSRDSDKLILSQELNLEDATESIDSYNGFGHSIDVSPDGEYLVVGIPTTSGIKTLFKGDFDPDTEYRKNDIIKYRENFWKANKTIIPQIGIQPFSTFDSYVTLVEQEDTDSTTLKLLVAGNPGLPTNNIDHFLVRAPEDMYIGTKGQTDGEEGTGDKVNLAWNRSSYAFPTLDAYLPFDGEIPALTAEFISQEHEIVEKIDAILYIDTYVSLPSVGDQVETDTGSGIVYYLETYRDSAVLYLKNLNGVMTVTGELFVSNGNFMGFYSQESTFATSDAVGGFWLIKTPFNYGNNGRYFDIGRGLVFADVRTSDSARITNIYSNIQNTTSEIGTFVNEENRASFITHLSYTGDPDGTEAPQPSNLWAVRISKDFTQELLDKNFYTSAGSESNQSLSFNFYNLDNSPVSLTNTGFDINELNQSHQLYDIWDGYIDFEFTEFDFQGNPFGLQVGDIVTDSQIPRDGQGGLALTSTSTSSAEVVFYQRNFNSVRIYVKVLSGSWRELNNIAKVEIQRSARDENDVDRIVGTISDTKNNIVIGTNLVGKLLIFQKQTGNFNISSNPAILNAEYYFYKENIEGGIPRLPNPPSELNKDYAHVYNIPLDARGTSSGLNNEGSVAIFRRQPNGKYDYKRVLTSQYKTNERRFGEKVRITQQDNLYTLMVSSDSVVLAGDDSTDRREHPGAIEIFYHGTEELDQFKGGYQLTQYNKGDIVIYKDDYYVANKDTDEAVISNITNSIVWDNISFRYGVDRDYKGNWDNSYGYQKDSIVLYDNKFYKALTNIAAGVQWITSYWKEVTNKFDYLGYLPNLTGNNYYGEDVYDPVTNIIEFSEAFDISPTGQVLAVIARIEESNSTVTKNLAIYRKDDSKYKLYQIIQSPNDIEDWGSQVSIAPDGLSIAVSAPKTTVNTLNQGAVYIYKQVNGQFVLDLQNKQGQIITSPTSELSELFGYKIALTDQNLVVTSLNGDQKRPTTFDVFSEKIEESIYVNDSLSTRNSVETTFDQNFTQFANTNIDSGMVYVYEDIQGSYTYSENFKFNNTTYEFGKNLHASNNHVYIGIPFYSDDPSKGIFLDYRKPKNKFAWNIYKEIRPPVDLDLIEGAFIYNKKENKIVSYVDYIDPIQGKVAGIAEQDITFKSYYDPAYYNVGSTNSINVNSDQTWLDSHVGQVWWDLTSARYVYPYQGSINYQKNNWSALSEGAEINVYEWVESDVLPSQWAVEADTEKGIVKNISGQPLYGDAKYSAKLNYDPLSQTFTTKYYFWVKDNKVIPSLENRNISVYDISQLIERPRENGYRYISFIGSDKIVLNNFDKLIKSNDLILNIKYKTKPTIDSNLHMQYKLIADGDSTATIPTNIERKWFDSLIGFDSNARHVPDSNLPTPQKYGILNSPRQGMFVNRTEALKQSIERINEVFNNNLIADEYNINELNRIDELPSISSGDYDVSIDTYEELQYISTNKLIQAVLTPIIINGRLERIQITNPGRGYKVPPTIEILGQGSDAEIKLEINNLGSVTNATIVNKGQGYDDTTSFFVRRFSVLVKSDSTSQDFWSIYGYNETSKTWFRRRSQSFDVSRYWNYKDWYAEGYNQFTKIDYEIDASYELQGLNPEFNSIIRINDIGSSGWLLLKRTGNSASEDYTIDYETIGRQNGTINLKSSLYNTQENISGYDNRTFDNGIYDNNPAQELRIILECIKNNIFINDLAIEYNQLFFSSIRYILAEQINVNWVFKSSFIKVNHKLSSLEQDITFNQDNKQYFQDYIQEVKPYKTQIREFISSVDAVEPTNTSVTDFDLSPQYNPATQTIEPIYTDVTEGVVRSFRPDATSVYPRKHFIDNLGSGIEKIVIKDPGSGYTIPPKVIIGDGTSSAQAQAYVGYGKITDIKIINPGNNFILPPTIKIEGSQADNGTVATAFARLSKGVVRTPTVKIKFDRIASEFYIENLSVTESITPRSTQLRYDLEWPVNLENDKLKIYVNSQELLKREYVIENIEKTDNRATFKHGRITFINQLSDNDIVTVDYYKSIELLDAADRINFAYNPTSSMAGKKLNQLMTGVDYGGVEVKSFDFDSPSGWDTQPWFTDSWDAYNNTFEDEVFTSDGSTIAVQLSAPLEDGIVYNFYKNGVRIDAPDYVESTPEVPGYSATNPYAETASMTGDGQTDIIYTQNLGIDLNDGDVFIVRKITSDGSIIADLASYDTQLQGGDLAYTKAQGVNAEEIVTDGDLFVSTTHAKTEEFIPGSVFDTLDITVHTRSSGGQGIIKCINREVASTGSFTHNLSNTIGSTNSIIVKYDGQILNDTQYTLDWAAQTVTIPNLLANKALSIIEQDQGSSSLLKNTGEIIVSQPLSQFILEEEWNEDISVHVTVNGDQIKNTFYSNLTLTEDDNRIVVEFEETLQPNDVINYSVFLGNAQVNYSQVVIDQFTGNGSTVDFVLQESPFYALPTEHNVVVQVGQKILNSGYNIEYTIPDNNQREYKLESFQQPPGSLSATGLKVFLNGEEIITPEQWRLDIANSSIILSDEAGTPGDLVEIYNISESEYRILGKQVTLSNPPQTGELISVYQYSNHDLLGIEKIQLDVVKRAQIISDQETRSYLRLTVGEIELRKPAVDAQYVWVTQNGTLLTPSVDYYITNDRKKVRLVEIPTDDDVIEIIHFAADVDTDGFSYRQFKDILNRTHFKRLDAHSTVLANQLNSDDLRIEVVDGSDLAEPDKGRNLPGIIFINGERIEYFVKEDNLLRQLRRGTLGTGVPAFHANNTKVYNQNREKTIPYKDTNVTQNVVADGINSSFVINFPVDDLNQVEVFVGGRRLRKSSIEIYNPSIAQNSPAGDETFAKEFDVINNTLILQDIPADQVTVTIVKKQGQIWKKDNEPLAEAQNSIARFLRAGTYEQPE